LKDQLTFIANCKYQNEHRKIIKPLQIHLHFALGHFPFSIPGNFFGIIIPIS